MDMTPTGSHELRSTGATIGARGTRVLLVLLVGTVVVGIAARSDGLISMLAVPLALFGAAATIGLFLGHAVERVRDARSDKGEYRQRRELRRPFFAFFGEDRCSLCGNARTRSGPAWLCPACDVGVAA